MRTSRTRSRSCTRALEQGINFVDTANAYSAGASERFVGKALQGGKRASVVLATKAFFPQDQKDPNARGLSRRHLIEACEASLQRLQTDWIDLYQVHRPQADIPIDETLRALDDLIRAGKVRYIGTSMFPAWKSVEALWAAKELGLNRFVCEQMAYNLLDRTAEREVIPGGAELRLALIPWAPLCGGLLTGKYRRDDQSAAGRWQGGKDNFGRPATPAAYDVIEGLVALAKEKGCTPSQLALAWNASQPGITAPIIGPAHARAARRQPRRRRRESHRRRSRAPRRRSRRRGQRRCATTTRRSRSTSSRISRAGERARGRGLTPRRPGVLPFRPSRAKNKMSTKPKLSFWAILGPGLLLAATGVGGGDLATATFVGGMLGTTVLWAVALGAFMKFVVTEGLARWQLATGETLSKASRGGSGPSSSGSSCRISCSGRSSSAPRR